MALLGMLSLGFFIGAIVTLGFKYANGIAGWGTLVATGVGAALGGASLAFINSYSGRIGDAIFFYPVGLALMVPWFYVDRLREMTSAKDEITRFIGGSGLIALALATFVMIMVACTPAFKQAANWVPPKVPAASATTTPPASR